MVWLIPSGDASRLHFAAASDSAIVSGLIALVLRVYSDRPAQEIVDTQPDFVQQIGLAKHLSPTRSNGLAAMLARIKAHASAVLAA
jgi:cysteine desulfuration protein SufE